MLERLARQGVGLDSLELFEELVSAEQMYWRARRARGWHHIAGLYDGANLRLAVDGVLDDKVIATGFKDSNIGLQIGARTANNFFFDGSISGVPGTPTISSRRSRTRSTPTRSASIAWKRARGSSPSTAPARTTPATSWVAPLGR